MMGHRILYIPKPKSDIFYPKYGLLYNWFITQDLRNVANTGWGVPNTTAVNLLLTHIGTQQGYAIREIGTTYWITANGTNTWNFNAKGASYRDALSENWAQLKSTVKWWTPQEYNSTNGRLYHTNDLSNYFGLPGGWDKKDGLSIRLVKDSTSLFDGQTGTYTGNDGKVYRTICIGTQEWLADNLSETKFRTGAIIPWYGASEANYFTNAEWGALITAGCCAYDNDETNVAEGFTFPT